MPQKRMECFRLLFNHLAWIEHQFLSGKRDSKKSRSLWRMMRSVGGIKKSIHQSSLAKGLGLGLLCWGFKGVQQEIPSEEASTLQIGLVAFPAGQSTSPQLMKELTIATHVMQSSPNKLSTPVSISTKCKQMKRSNTYMLNSLAYVKAASGCEVVLSGWYKVCKVSTPAEGISYV